MLPRALAAQGLGEHLRRLVEQAELQAEGKQRLKSTISVGVASGDERGEIAGAADEVWRISRCIAPNRRGVIGWSRSMVNGQQRRAYPVPLTVFSLAQAPKRVSQLGQISITSCSIAAHFCQVT